jgi:cytochrome P450
VSGLRWLTNRHGRAKKLSGPVEVGGCSLTAGTLVMPAIALVHSSPGVYPEPGRFLPERSSTARKIRFTSIPLWRGCTALSWSELRNIRNERLSVKELLRRFDRTPVSEQEEKPKIRGVTLIPASEARVQVHAV